MSTTEKNGGKQRHREGQMANCPKPHSQMAPRKAENYSLVIAIAFKLHNDAMKSPVFNLP